MELNFLNKMSDPASEYDSGIELVIRSYKRLEKSNPHHELLRFISIKDDGKSFIINPNTREELLSKFGYNDKEMLLPWASIDYKYSLKMNKESRRIENKTA